MSENVKEVACYQFDAEVLKSPVPVIVDFWAPLCGPCRIVAPEFEKLAVTHGATTRFVKVNVDEANEVAARFSVLSIPTLAKFDGGNMVAQIVGARGADSIAKEFGLV